MTIGTHMATLNLFREADGALEITVAGASQELMGEWRKAGEIGRPIDYVDALVVQAAHRMESRLHPELAKIAAAQAIQGEK